MHALYQRLKELNANDFEKLVFHLARERHPNVDLKRVEGSGGDAGIDSFAGDLDDGPVIWQAKSFPNGVGKSQKEQIRQSLRRAVQHSKPCRWILCLSVDLDTKSHTWLQHLVKSYAPTVSIGLVDASQMVHELIYRHKLREAFFPNAIFDTSELMAVLGKTGELTTEELRAVTAENVSRYLDRLRARDARFNYQIVFSDNGQPKAASGIPGLLACLSDGTKTVQVFARDHEALRLDPIKANFTVQGTGVAKFNELVRTGKPQDFTVGELARFSTGFDFLMPIQDDARLLQLHIGPAADAKRIQVPLRVKFGAGEGSVTYEWIPFEVSRVGTEEMELSSAADLPFQMSVVWGPPNLTRGKIDFEFTFLDREITNIQKFMRAMAALQSSNSFELYNLETGRVLCRGDVGEDVFEGWDEGLRRLVDHAVEVSKHYGVELRYRIPEAADLEVLRNLHELIQGSLLPAKDLTLNLTKVAETPEALEMMKDRATYRLLVTGGLQPVPALFGVPIPTGPIVWTIPGAAIDNPEEALDQISNAAIGDSFAMKLNLSAPVEVRAMGIQPE